MNPYTSLWTGATEGQELHVVLLDNGRTNALRDRVGRQALQCIRCSACLNVCPVYSRTGGHAYGSVYPGPIGAILTPQLVGIEQAPTLPFASTLCGACADVCPVKIEIPKLLLHLRAQAPKPVVEQSSFAAVGLAFDNPRRYRLGQKLARLARGPLQRIGPLRAWTNTRDLRPAAPQSFRDWWSGR
jgi:L-lactate dehydrogenase complex protein LldF